MPVEGSGERILCIELSALPGDQSIDFAFFFGNGVEMPALARLVIGCLSRSQDFALKRLCEFPGPGCKGSIDLCPYGVVALCQPGEKLVKGCLGASCSWACAAAACV